MCCQSKSCESGGTLPHFLFLLLGLLWNVKVNLISYCLLKKKQHSWPKCWTVSEKIRHVLCCWRSWVFSFASRAAPWPERWQQPVGALLPEPNRKPQTSLNKHAGEAMEGVGFSWTVRTEEKPARMWREKDCLRDDRWVEGGNSVFPFSCSVLLCSTSSCFQQVQVEK